MPDYERALNSAIIYSHRNPSFGEGMFVYDSSRTERWDEKNIFILPRKRHWYMSPKLPLPETPVSGRLYIK